jgi:glycosyltransferase involved in cell wall biosynthesis
MNDRNMTPALGNPRLLIVGAFLSDSTGIRFMCEELAVRLAPRGWRITTTSSIRSRGLRLIDMLSTVWLKRYRYSVAQMDVYSHSAFLWAEAVGASLTVLRCPYVITLHSGAFPEFAERYPSRVRRLLKSATMVTSPSPFLRQYFGPIRPDIQMVRNGLDIGRYAPRVISKAEPRLVWIRAFEKRYNPILALEAVARLLPDFPAISLLMVGPDREDWSARETLEAAQSLGLEGHVRLMPAVPKTDIPRILQQGDIFLNTTNVDNAPVTVVEAMASGLCVVSTDAGGVPYLVDDGENALLVPRRDPDAMAGAIRSILRDPDLAWKLSTRGRATAEEYDWARILPQWEEILGRCAARQ